MNNKDMKNINGMSEGTVGSLQNQFSRFIELSQVERIEFLINR